MNTSPQDIEEQVTNETTPSYSGTGATSEQSAMLALIERVALDPRADPTRLGQLLILRERMLRNEARQVFAADFVRMKPRLPRIIKTHKNDQTRSLYAKLEDINEQLDPLLEKFGFGTATKIVAQTDSLITVRCELWHQQGHVEFTDVSMPPDDSGIAGKVNKTKPHAIASTITYLKRVGLCALLNISTGDDKDGNVPDTNISEEQAAEIRQKMMCVQNGEARILKYMKVATVEDIPSRLYPMAVSALNQEIAKEAANADPA